MYKIALVQSAASGNISANLAKTAKYIKQAAAQGADIVCLQELFYTRYFPQYKEDKKFFALAEKIPGGITRFLANAAKENHVTLIGGSLFEMSIPSAFDKAKNSSYYNTSLVFGSSGKLLLKYRKMHIPHDKGYYEKDYFMPGNLGHIQAAVDGIILAPRICYDQWMPEVPRIAAVNNAHLVTYPTAIGWFDEMKRQEPNAKKMWEQSMATDAFRNAVFIAAANRVGKEGNLAFWGSSFVADPFGNIIAQASEAEEELLIAELDLEKIIASRESWGFLKNRRPGSYGELVKR